VPRFSVQREEACLRGLDEPADNLFGHVGSIPPLALLSAEKRSVCLSPCGSTWTKPHLLLQAARGQPRPPTGPSYRVYLLPGGHLDRSVQHPCDGAGGSSVAEPASGSTCRINSEIWDDWEETVDGGGVILSAALQRSLEHDLSSETGRQARSWRQGTETISSDCSMRAVRYVAVKGGCGGGGELSDQSPPSPKAMQWLDWDGGDDSHNACRPWCRSCF